MLLNIFEFIEVHRNPQPCLCSENNWKSRNQVFLVRLSFRCKHRKQSWNYNGNVKSRNANRILIEVESGIFFQQMNVNRKYNSDSYCFDFNRLASLFRESFHHCSSPKLQASTWSGFKRRIIFHFSYAAIGFCYQPFRWEFPGHA